MNGVTLARWTLPSLLPAAKPTLRRSGLGALGLATLGLLWWACSSFLTQSELGAHFTPALVFEALAELLAGGELLPHVLVSLERVGIGLAAALLLGGPLGVLIGSSAHVDELTSPTVQFLRMISPLSWMPLAVLVFGVGDPPIWFLLTFAAVWPIVLATAAGVRQIPEEWLELGRSLAATQRELFLHIVLPALVPHVLTGVRLAIGILWIVLVPAEMLGVSEGLGYFILDARDRLAYSELMALVIVIGALGFALDSLARRLCRRAAPGDPAIS